MDRKLLIYFSLFFSLFGLTTTIFAEPENLGTAKQNVIQYHDSGAYDYDITVVANQAHDYLQARLAQNPQQKLAIVFDIDDTVVTFYDFRKVDDFSSRQDILIKMLSQPKAPAIKPILDLYNFALKNNVAIFFVTGRSETLRDATKVTLTNAGYKNWSGLYMRSAKDAKRNTVDFKSSWRKQIENDGYDVVLNVGDQYSDMAGGHADRSFKLPNPYYIVP